MLSTKENKTRDLKFQLVTLLQQHHLLSAADLLTKLAKTHRQYNKTSVYRSLDALVEAETICKHYFDNGQAVFEIRDHHHAHLYCKSCGKVQETDCQVTESPKTNQFVVDHHHLTYIGTCSACI